MMCVAYIRLNPPLGATHLAKLFAELSSSRSESSFRKVIKVSAARERKTIG